jgi:hypothetical protein
MYRRLEVDKETVRRSNRALEKALRRGKPLTRDELRQVLQRAGVATQGELRMGYLMMHAELDGLVCSGPRRGKQFTYMLLGERAPQARPLAKEEALAEIAGRYFTSRGPATVYDFAKWSGLTLGESRRGLEAVRDRLEQEVAGDQAYWFASATSTVKASGTTTHLLSIYDEYISGYKDRSAIGDAADAARLYALGNALQYILILNGRLAGTWKRTLKKDAVVVELDFFRPLTKAEKRAVAAAADRYGAYLELPLVLAQARAAPGR